MVAYTSFSVFYLIGCSYNCLTYAQNGHSHSTEVRLRQDLLGGYDKSVRPIPIGNETATAVSASMYIKSFVYDMDRHKFSLNFWYHMVWTDNRLVWLKKDYENIDFLRIDSHVIWKPDLVVLNRADKSDIIKSIQCIVFKTGLVMCTPPSKQIVMCKPNFARYPFEIQTCSLEIGLWLYSNAEVKLSTSNTSIGLDELTENPEFYISKVNATNLLKYWPLINNLTYSCIKYTFILESNVSGVISINFVPGIVLIVFCLATFFTKIESKDRLHLSCCNVIVHFIYIITIWWTLPFVLDETPLFLTYWKYSFMMVGLVLIYSLILRKIHTSEVQPPKLIIFIAYLSLRSSTVLGNHELQQEMDGSKNWIAFSRVLDKLMFMIFLMSYTLMCLNYLY